MSFPGPFRLLLVMSSSPVLSGFKPKVTLNSAVVFGIATKSVTLVPTDAH